MYPNKLQFRAALRRGAQHLRKAGLVLRAAYGIFYTPVDMNTWCNQRAQRALCVSRRPSRATISRPPASTASISAQPVLGKTVISFSAFDPYPPAQYIQQWSASVQKSLGTRTTLEIGYHGEHGLHLQRSHLINNALPGPGPLQPRRPYQSATFLPGTVIPADVSVASTTFPVSTINLLENTATELVRRRIRQSAPALLARAEPAGELHLAKNLSDAPDFPFAHVRGGYSAEQRRSRGRKGSRLRHPPPLRL